MNKFILKHQITSGQFLAYLSFYYLVSFFFAIVTPKTFFGFFTTISFISIPLPLIPWAVKNAVFEIGGGDARGV